jgi:YVTN family beta-propeller protein
MAWLRAITRTNIGAVSLTLTLVTGCGSRQSERPSGDAAVVGGDTGSESLTGAVSFTNDIYPTVLTTCAVATCHISATQMNHYADFSTTALTYARWVNAPGSDFCVTPDLFVQKTVVVPGQPAYSLLIEKISSTREEPCNDNHYPRMPPPPRPALSGADIERWTRWIAEGAMVLVLNATTLATLNEIEVGDMPAEVTFSPDGRQAWVANNMSNTVNVISPGTKTVVATIPVGEVPVVPLAGRKRIRLRRQRGRPDRERHRPPARSRRSNDQSRLHAGHGQTGSRRPPVGDGS